MLKLLIFVAVLGIAFAFPQTDNQNQPAGVKDVDLEGRFGGIGHQHHGGHQPHGQQQFGHGYGQQGVIKFIFLQYFVGCLFD